MYKLYRKHKIHDWEVVEQEEKEEDIRVLEMEYRQNHDRSYLFKVEKDGIAI